MVNRLDNLSGGADDPLTPPRQSAPQGGQGVWSFAPDPA